MCCVNLKRPTLFPEVSCGRTGVLGLCVNNMVLEAKELFVFLASGGYQTQTRAFFQM